MILDWPGDEVMPKDGIVKMRSESDEGKPIFLIHPGEGIAASLQDVASRLSRPVYGFQHTIDTPCETISEMAAHYIKLARTVQELGPLDLVGYSFGAVVAFEMALQLGDEAPETLFLIDGSPLFVEVHSKNYISKKIGEKDDSLTEGLKKALAVFVQMLNPKSNRLETFLTLRDIRSEEEVFNHLPKLINNPKHNNEDIKTAARFILKRLWIGSRYKPSKLFEGEIVFTRIKNYPPILGHDYGLSKISTSPVTIEEVDANHQTIVHGASAKKCAEIIRSKL